MARGLEYYPAELHLHTVLSPCAEVEMLPPLIMERAAHLGLRLLAVTDHNSAENAGVMVEAGRRAGIAVLPGMEVQTREEVHLLCLFDTVEQDMEWQEQVYAALPALPNREDLFGSQLRVDVEGDFVAYNDRLLLTSTSLSVEEVFERVGKLGGAVVPAHVDRPAFSLLVTLGLIPAGLDVPALEITSRLTAAEARRTFVELRERTLICNGDAHRLDEMQGRTMFKLQRPAVEELLRAFRHQEGRKVILD